MIGQAEEDNDIKFTKKRLEIHNKVGAKALMLEMPDGSLVSPHLQPRLSKDVEPIQLLMLYRPSKYDEEDSKKTTELDIGMAKALMVSFINNFDTEGFAPEDVQEARDIIEAKFAKAKRAVLVPPSELPNVCELAKHDEFLMAQTKRTFGDLEAHEKKIQEALHRPVDPKKPTAEGM
jgi:hypothetical protein